MNRHTRATLLLCCGCAVLGCAPSPRGDAAATSAPRGADPEITAFIGRIRAVDNHSHANSVAPGDSDQDALPLEAILPFDVPVQLRPDNPDWLAAYKAVYKYPHVDMSDAHLNELRSTMQGVAKEQGDKFPRGCWTRSAPRCCSRTGLPWARDSRRLGFVGCRTWMR